MLLDVRFDHDKDKPDRLGDIQWQWLEEVFKNDTESNVTILVSGIQIIPDRWFVTEVFHEPDRNRLFSLIDKY